MHPTRVLLAGVLWLWAGSAIPCEQGQELATEAVAARVGGEPIRGWEVNARVRQAMQQAKFAPEAWPVVQATALAELVNRRLVLAYARRTGTEPDPRRVDARVAERKASGSAAGKGPEDEAADASEEALVREAAWGLAWEAYLRRYRTDARIAAYFEEHRREFDGTELEVRHILLRPSPGDRQAAKALVERAQAIRAEILSGKITFEEAARRYSAGPSARDGGWLGAIPRRGVMDESFSRAAFALKAGEISAAVRSPFGVHLIRCDGVRPGGKSLRDARPAIEDALAGELLARIAEAERRHTAVEFTGESPHFESDGQTIVEPRGTKGRGG